jgi:plasmid stability protein
MKVTIDLDAELYRAVKVEAARADRSVREIVDEALAAWLERLEDAEDAAAAVEALAEYERDGGVAADEFFRAHAAETRAAYGPTGEGPGSTDEGPGSPGGAAGGVPADGRDRASGEDA